VRIGGGDDCLMPLSVVPKRTGLVPAEAAGREVQAEPQQPMNEDSTKRSDRCLWGRRPGAAAKAGRSRSSAQSTKPG